MKNLLRWINWFNREKVALLIGSLILALGAIYPWYRLPPQALETFGTNLFWANLGRVPVAFLAIIGLVFTFRSIPSRVPRLPLWSGLILTLLFPYFITTWSPTVAFLAQAYFYQGQGVRNHVESHFPDIQAQWKQNIALATSRPISSISDFAIADSRFFQMSSWDQILIEGLGYSNSFFGFIGRGWAFTVIGLVICLAALYLGLKKEEKFNCFLSDMSKFLPWVAIGFGSVVLSLIVPNIVNHQLDSLYIQGQYQQVVTTSQTLAYWYPPLKGDQEFLKRMGEAGFYANKPDPALINFAKGVEHYKIGNFLKAEDYFQRSLSIQPKQFLVRGYLASSILNQGINYFNDSKHPSNHKPGVAADRFEEALRLFPGHIEALYDLMIARVVNGEFEKSASVGKQIRESQTYFQQPILGLLGQAYLHASWASYHNNDLKKAWKQYRQSIDSSTWKKSEEANK